MSGSVIQHGSLYICGSVIPFGSLQLIGSVVDDGSLKPDGSVRCCGSLISIGSVCYQGSLYLNGSLLRHGSLVHNGSLFPKRLALALRFTLNLWLARSCWFPRVPRLARALSVHSQTPARFTSTVPFLLTARYVVLVPSFPWARSKPVVLLLTLARSLTSVRSVSAARSSWMSQS